MPRVPEGWSFTLPAGDAVHGGWVFSKRECYSCHRVAGRSFRRVDAGGVGPDLGPGHAEMPAAYLAESVLNPDKVIAGEERRYRAEDGRSSRMRDYSEVMTLRELVDVVAYLQSVR
jgi:mono/diheme cytochrome c family protein